MKQLIIEASGRQLGLLLDVNGQWFDQVIGDDGRHDQRLLPSLEALIASAGVTFSEIDRVGVGIGPGSFTGIRVALATAQGICLGRGIDLHGIDSLALMAAGLPDGRYHFALDARLGEVYQAVYLVERSGVSTLLAPFLSRIEDLQAPAADDQPIGDGWGLIEHPFTPIELNPNGAWLALLDQTPATAPEACEPAYLRDTVNWKKLSEQPSPLSK